MCNIDELTKAHIIEMSGIKDMQFKKNKMRPYNIMRENWFPNLIYANNFFLA